MTSPSYFTFELHQSYGNVSNAVINRRLFGENNNSRLDGYLSPLFQGMGTHYSFIYVGSPPQRVSVIVDTGSHHTAFPCVGCKCGKHMDPHFDPKKSSSAVVKSCNGKNRCVFKQSYSEGSSWQAYKVRDVVWIGGEQPNQMPHAAKYSINFEFGCQSSETGLFRTQHVDGIMGFSSQPDTLPHQLVAQRITSTKLFAMCFRNGGGALSLGGFDPSLHRQTEVKYANLVKSSGWFTVKLLDIFLKDPRTGTMRSIGENPAKYNGGKGVIVDSGTTDTYLPSSVRNAFQSMFNSMSRGVRYSNNKISLTEDKLLDLPTVVYRIAGKTTEYVDIHCPPTSYAESLRDKSSPSTVNTATSYAFRIYLTEGSGTVLGANFMNDHNVIFDIDGGRIGFAESNCDFNLTNKGTVSEKEVHVRQSRTQAAEEFKCSARLLAPCSAQCADVAGDIGTSYVATGTQIWGMGECQQPVLLSATSNQRSEQCFARCSTVGVSDGSLETCWVGTWSSCTSNCTQHRMVSGGKSCTKNVVESRECASSDCPVGSHDFTLTLQISLGTESAKQFTEYQAEDLLTALSRALQVPVSNMHINVLKQRTGLWLQAIVRVYQERSNTENGADVVKETQSLFAQTADADFAAVVTSIVNGPSAFSGHRKWLKDGDLMINSVELAQQIDGAKRQTIKQHFNKGAQFLEQTNHHNNRHFSINEFMTYDGMLFLVIVLLLSAALFILKKKRWCDSAEVPKPKQRRERNYSRDKVISHILVEPDRLRKVF